MEAEQIVPQVHQHDERDEPIEVADPALVNVNATEALPR